MLATRRQENVREGVGKVRRLFTPGPEAAVQDMAVERSPRRTLAGRLKWLVFYVGFQLSPLTPGNDALVNQLPSSLLAAAIVHASSGSRYGEFYTFFYVASNVAGVLMMLVNLPELRRKWRRLMWLRREQPRRFVRVIIVDLLTFAAFLFLGQFVFSLAN